MIKRVFLIVLDSVGIGELPDAAAYGDLGSNTLVNTASAVGGMFLPNLAALGLGKITAIEGVASAIAVNGAYGRAASMAHGKDTTSGHWEMMGCILDQPLPTFPDGFPAALVAEFERRIGRHSLGNQVASGTIIIEELGAEHLKTGMPIIYTSADSVFQIAAHEDIIPLAELYQMCEAAREILTGAWGVGRVIARPFIGEPGRFIRTANRHDYSLPPISLTGLDRLKEAGKDVIAVGKISDIFAGRGIGRSLHTAGNNEGMAATFNLLAEDFQGLAFINLVDFDMKYGHRNDAHGYASALEEFDRWLGNFKAHLKGDDLLIITADHGCDPTTCSTDHSREYVPLLVGGQKITGEVNLGVRQTFADTGKTVCDLLGVNAEQLPGHGFADLLGINA
ncbi:MAG: phosphopentomutase [Methylocystaceae bacterium]